MVGIISSSGLGLFDSSADRLGSPHGNPTSLGQAKGSAYVNIATGNLSVQFLDETLSGTGADLSALRTYNSQGGYVDGDADGWRWNGEKKVVLHAGSINQAGSILLRTTGDGTYVTYGWDGSAYVSTAGSGAHDTIVRNPSTGDWLYLQDTTYESFEVTAILTGTANSAAAVVTYNGASFKWDGVSNSNQYISTDGFSSIKQDTANNKWRFQTYASVEKYDVTSGWIKSVRDSSGNGFDYTFSGNKLTHIRDLQSGQTLEFFYGGNTYNQLSQIKTSVTATGSLTKQVYYTYDASGRLSSVTTDLTPTDNSISDNNVYTTNYTYHSDSGLIASISQTSDGTSASFTYAYINNAWRIASVSDQTGTTTFSYDISSSTTIVKNGNNDNWAYTYDALGQLISHTSSFNNGIGQKASYTYDSQGNVKTITDGRDKTVTYDYDNSGNRIKEYDSLGNTITRTFGAGNFLLTETKYSVASTTSPGGAETTQYIYDSFGRVRYTVSSEGRVSQSRYNGLGLLSWSVVYAGEKYSGSIFTETALDAWVTSLPLAKKQNSELIGFTYDYRGNLSRKVEYANFDSSGNGLIDNAATITEYTYSEHGQLLQTIAVRGTNRDQRTTLSSYGYDGMGRQITAINDNVTTTTSYSGLNITVTNTATGLTTTSTTDSLGRLISLTQSGSGTNRITKYYYDNAGQLRMTEDPTGARSYLFYDHVGRVYAKVDPSHSSVSGSSTYFSGKVSAFTYDADGRVLTKTDHYSSATTNSWFDGTNVTKQNLNIGDDSVDRDVYTEQDGDIVTTYTYDSAGRLETTTHSFLAPIINTYDGASRLIKTAQGDSITRYYYDKDGKKIGMLDAERYLTDYEYDAAGRLKYSQRYGSIQATEAQASWDFFSIRATVNNGPRLTTFYYYDAQGRQVGVLNEQGFLTETVYDEALNRRQTIQYKTPVSADENTLLSTLKANAGASNTTTIQYDVYGRVDTITQQNGMVSRNVYDSAGRLVRQIDGEGDADWRITHTRLNAFNEVTGIVTGDAALNLTVNTDSASVNAVNTAITNNGTRYDIDGAGRKIAEYQPNGQKTLFYYDDAGRIILTINATGDVTHTIYNYQGKAQLYKAYTTRINTDGLTGGKITATLTNWLNSVSTDAKMSSNSYNSAGLIEGEYKADGSSVIYTYNNRGEISNSRQYNNVGTSYSILTEYTRDKLGRVISTRQDKEGLNILASQIVYDGFGRIKDSYDANGQITHTDYLENGRSIQITDPLGRKIKTEIDFQGRTLKTTDALGNVTSYTYEDASRKFTVTNADGTTITTWKTGRDETLKVQDANGGITQYSYNKDGKLKSVTDALNQITTDNTFDNSGRIFESKDANGTITRYSYDSANRIVQKAVDPNGLNLRTYYVFDGQGRQTEVTTGFGTTEASTTKYVYNRNGQITQMIVDPTGLQLSTKFVYDNLGQTIEVHKGTSSNISQQITKYEFDKLGRKISERIDPTGLNITTKYQYDNAGNLVKKIDANGNTTQFVYDGANQLRFTVNAEGAVSENIYDANGNVVRTIQYGSDLTASKLGDVLNTNVYESNSTSASSWYVYDSGGTGGTITKVYDSTLKQNVAQLTGNYRSTGYYLTMDTSGNSQQRIISWDMKYSEEYYVFVSVNTNKGHRYLTYIASDAAPSGADVGYPLFGLGTNSIDGSWKHFTRDLAADLASLEPDAVITNVNAFLVRGSGKIANVGLSTDAKAVSEKIEALKVQGSFSENNARITNFTYDKANRLRFTVNAEGSVSENVYDANGNVIRKVDYANQLPSNGALKLFYREGTNRSAAQYLGNFAKGDVVTATVRYKASSDIGGAVFLGDAGGVDPYDNDTYLSVSGNDGWRTITVSRTMTHDDGMHIYVYALGSHSSHNVIYDNITVTSVNRGNVLTENFSNGISNWSISGYAEATQTGNVLSANLTSEFLSSLADAKQDRVSSFAYDKANRLRFTVNAEGAVSENIYDANGNVVRTINYAKKINVPAINSTDNNTISLTGNGGWLTSNERFAVDTNKSYTITARIRQVSGQGAVYVGVQTYDANGNLIWNPNQGNFSYAAAGGITLTPEMGWQTFTGTITGVDPIVLGASMNKFLAGTVTAAPLLLYNYYDDNTGDLSRTVELDSFELIDNATGETLNLNSSMQLGTSNWGNWHGGIDSANNPVSYLSEEQFKKLLRPDSANDRITVYTYDKANRLRFTVNAEGAVSENIHDANGNVVRTVQYGSDLTAAKLGNVLNTNTYEGNNTPASNWYVYDSGGTGGTITKVFDAELNQNVVQLSGNATGTGYTFSTDWNNQEQTVISWDMKYSQEFVVYVAVNTNKGELHMRYDNAPRGMALAQERYFVLGDQATDGKWHHYTRDLVADLASVDPTAVINSVRSVYIRGSGRLANISLMSDAKAVSEKIETLKAQGSFSDNNARITNFTYDKANRLRFTVNAEGSVSENIYDANGNVVRTVSYANKLSANEITSLTTTNSAGTNRLNNGTFSNPANGIPEGWSFGSYLVSANVNVNYSPDWTLATSIPDEKTLFIQQNSTGVSGAYQEVYQSMAGITAGTNYTFSVYAGAHRATSSVHIVWYDINGNSLGSTPEDAASRVTSYEQNGGPSLSGYKRIVAKGTAPQGAVKATILIRKYNTDAGQGDSYLFAARPQFEVGTLQPSDWAKPLLKPSDSDRITNYTYDKANRLRFTVNAEGAVSENIYDANGNVVASTQFNSIPSLAGDYALSNISSKVNRSDSLNRVTTYSYDAMNRLRYSTNAEGAVTETVYDAFGNAIRTIEYANKLSAFDTTADGVGANLLTNSTFTNVTNNIPNGWAVSYRVSAPTFTGVNRYASQMVLGMPAGDNTAYIYQSGSTTGTEQDLTQTVSVTAGKKYIFSAYTGVYGAKGRAQIQWLNASGTVIGSTTLDAAAINDREKSGGNDLTNYKRLVAQGTAPTGATQARVVLTKENTQTGFGDSWFWVAHTQFEEVAATTLVPSAFVPLIKKDSQLDRSTHFAYDKSNNLRYTVNAEGAVSENIYDSHGNITQTIAYYSAKITGPYTFADLESFANTFRAQSLNRNTYFAYDKANRLRFTVNAEGYVTENTYDVFGNVKTVSHFNTKLTNPTSYTETYISGAVNRSDTTNRTTAYDYDKANRQTKTTLAGWYDESEGKVYSEKESQDDRFQRTIEVTYDSFGNAVTNKIRTGSGAGDFIYQYKTYDKLNREVHDIDGLGYVTKKTYYSNGELKTVMRVANPITVKTSGYWSVSDVDGLISTSATRVIEYRYDKVGRQTQVIQPYTSNNFYGGQTWSAAPVTTNEYNVFGELVKQSQQIGTAVANSYFYYDKLGRQVWNVNAEGYGTQTEYSSFGDVLQTTEFSNRVTGYTSGTPTYTSNFYDRKTTNTYDKLGRVKTTSKDFIDAANNKTTTQISSIDYNAFGEVWKSRDALNNETRMEYNKLGQVAQVVEPSRSVASYAADRDVFKTGITTATPTSYITYSAFGERLSESREGIVIEHQYDLAGNEIATKDGMGYWSYQGFDVSGKVIRQWQTVGVMNQPANTIDPTLSSSMTLDRRFEYDAAGRQIATVDIYNSRTQLTGQLNVYNGYGEVIEERKIWGGYNDDGKAGINTLTYKNTATMNVLVSDYKYDEAGRVKLKHGADGYTHYFYDLAGRVTQTIQRETETGTTNQRVTILTLDKLGRATAQQLPSYQATSTYGSTTPVPQTPVINRSYDRWGNVLSESGSTPTKTVTYNQDNQVLTEEGDYEYMITLSGTAPAVKLRKEYTYNTLGNLLTERQIAVAGAGGNYGDRIVVTNTYNNIGQLTFTQNAIQKNQAVGTSYVYDIHGNRIGTKNALGHVWTDEFNKNGQLITHNILRKDVAVDQTLANNASEYKSENVAVKSIKLAGYRYNEAGQKYGEEIPSSVAGYVDTQFTYFDERGLITAIRSRDGGYHRYAYDELGNKILEQMEHTVWTSNMDEALPYDDPAYDPGFTPTFTSSQVTDTINSWSYRDRVNTNDFKDYQSDKLQKRTVGIDTAGQTYFYDYTGFGQLSQEVNSADSRKRSTYLYWENGLQKEIRETFGQDANQDKHKAERYYYDGRGNKTVVHDLDYLQAIKDFNVFGYGGVVVGTVTNGTIAPISDHYQYYEFDSLNRVKRAQSPQTNLYAGGFSYTTYNLTELAYAYDEWGNRRRVTEGGNHIWFGYNLNDQMTFEAIRFENSTTNASPGALTIGTGVIKTGLYHSYDTQGRRVVTEQYSGTKQYTAHVVDVYSNKVYTFNDLGLITQNNQFNIEYRTGGNINNRVYWGPGGTSIPSVSTVYDNRGFKRSETTLQGTTTYTYNRDGQQINQTFRDTGGTVRNSTSYTYDGLGNLEYYTYYHGYSNNFPSNRIDYNYEYVNTFAGRQVKNIRVTSNQSGTKPGATTNTYDWRGRLTNVSIREAKIGDPSKTGLSYLRFAYDAAGQILLKSKLRYGETVTKTQTYFYSPTGGQMANFGTLEGNNPAPLSAFYDGSSVPGSYTVSEGDSLMGIAQMLFGDSKLWYLIADLNSLSMGPTDTFSAADAGRTLRIPNNEKSISNTSSNWKPYNPTEIIGDLTPSLKIVPPKAKGCNTFAIVLMVIVAVVVTVLTAGAAATFFAGAGGVTTASGVAATTMSTGMAALAGGTAAGVTIGSTAAAVAGAVVGGFVGSIASQGVGVMMGVQDKISLRQAAGSGLTAGFTAGAGSYLQGLGWATKGMEAGKLNAYGRMAQGAMSYAGSYSSNKIAGLETTFRWSDMAVASTAAFIGGTQTMGDTTRAIGNIGGSFGQNVVGNFMGSALNSGLSRLTGRGSTMHGDDWGAMAADAFGNALATEIVEYAQKPKPTVVVDPFNPQMSRVESEFEKKLRQGNPNKSGMNDGDTTGLVTVSKPYVENKSETIDRKVQKDVTAGGENIADKATAARDESAFNFNFDLENVDLRQYGLDYGYGDNISFGDVTADSLMNSGNSFSFGANEPSLWDQITSGDLLGAVKNGFMQFHEMNTQISKYVLGTGEIVASGIWNSGVEIVGGAGSLPYLVFGVDASVAVQEGFSNEWSWTPQTEGANSIMNNVLAPVGSWMGGHIDDARYYSESHIGIGGTSLLFGGVEAGTEILALFTGTKSVQAGLKMGMFSKVTNNNILQSTDRKFLTGIDKFDELVVGTKRFDNWISAVENRTGYKVRYDSGLNDNAQINLKTGEFIINPDKFDYLSMRHEGRHFTQLKINGNRGLDTDRMYIQSEWVNKYMERGAYEFERSIVTKYGKDKVNSDWLKHNTERINDYWTKTLQTKELNSSTFRSKIEKWFK